MSAQLADFQFDLDGYVFGLGCDISLLDGGFDPGTAEWRTQDQDNPVGDGRVFGRDYLSGPTWGFSLFVDATDPETALAAWGDVSKAWRNEGGRRTPGAVCTLRYAVAGRTRRVYGRPRRFAGTPDNKLLQGTAPITTDFDCADALHYDDVEQSVVVPILPATTGGFMAPFIFPLSTLSAPGPRQGTITVDGDADCPVVIKVHGPVSAPVVTGPGWLLNFAGLTLAYDEELVIDTRPWAKTALVRGGSVAGTLTRQSTRLTDVRLALGDQAITFAGIDETASASCTLFWRPTWTSL